MCSVCEFDKAAGVHESIVAECINKYPIELYKMKLNETTYDLETFKL